MRNYVREDRITFFILWIWAYCLAKMLGYSYITLISIALLPVIFSAGWIISNLINGDFWHTGMTD